MIQVSSAAATLAGSAALVRDWLGVGRARHASHAARARGRHVALFAWALPPNSNAGVHRPLSLLRHGCALGWRFTTVQGVAPPNQSQHGGELLARVPPSVQRIVVPTPTRPVAWRPFPHVDGGFTNAVEYARVAINAMGRDPPDVVVASGPPFSVFLSARWVARAFGVPLVLDYRDEWTQCPFEFVTAGADDLRYERACLADAAAVIFTTRAHIEHALQHFPELDRSRVHMVRNGWEPDDLEAPPIQVAQTSTRSGPLRLAHVGTLSGHTSPAAFLARWDQTLNDDARWRDAVTVDFVGRRSPEAHQMLQASTHVRQLRLVDHVSKREAMRRMGEADALLLLAAPELERYLPGKLFDYLATGRPVLIFGHAGEASRLLVDELDAGVLCEAQDQQALARAFEQLKARRAVPPSSKLQRWLDDHRRDVLAARFFGVCESVVEARR